MAFYRAVRQFILSDGVGAGCTPARAPIGADSSGQSRTIVRPRRRKAGAYGFLLAFVLPMVLVQQLKAQGTTPTLQLVRPAGQTAAPIVITFEDALEMAQKLDLVYQTALLDSLIANEDRAQAKNA